MHSFINNKIKTKNQLLKIIKKLKSKNKKIIFTNGCFDILHYGHVKYLQKAKNLGDILIVGLNSDASIRRLKGKTRPIIAQKDRAMLLAALESVDFVVIFNEDTPFNLIKYIMPDVLVKGGDWSKKDIIGADLVKSGFGKVATIPYIKGYSTTKIINKLSQCEK